MKLYRRNFELSKIESFECVKCYNGIEILMCICNRQLKIVVIYKRRFELDNSK